MSSHSRVQRALVGGMIVAAATLFGSAWSPLARARGAHRGALRVCADPNNLPFSNRAGEGFENKIAAFVARDLGDTLEYTWWPQRRGWVRTTST